jgi:M6 family metalloprotease-like protein
MSAIFGEIVNTPQKNGPDIPLRVFGDEDYARLETIDGYTVVFDDGLGVYCYAVLRVNEFKSSGVPASEPPPAGVVRHLQESLKVRQSKAEARSASRRPPGMPDQDTVVRTFGPNQGLLEGRVLSSGLVRGLTILVNFQDVTSTTTAADVDEMLNGADFTRNGNICSAREYFRRMSSGKLDYTNMVVGPFTLSRNRDFYHSHLLVPEALQFAVNSGVDLKQFDSRNEGIVDALNILYAGPSQFIENSNLWPHNSVIDLRFGTMRTNLYLLTSLGRAPSELTIGTFCHENGHLLCRFPDMYDYGKRDGDGLPSSGIGNYCLMGSGNHLGGGLSPSPVCAYLRDLAGWCDQLVDLNTPGVYTAVHGDYRTVMKYRCSRPNEYFLVENRTRMDMDRAGDSNGLAIYHCDTLGSNELQQGTAEKHYQCALLQADGRRDLENDPRNRGDGSDLFGAVPGTAISNISRPDSREWDGRDSELILSDISAPDNWITFRAGRVGTPPGRFQGEHAPDREIPDNQPVGISDTISVPTPGIVSRLRISVEIRHSYIGDLIVELMSPSGRRAVLHSRQGGSTHDLVQSYDSSTSSALSPIVGQPSQGAWILRVSDHDAVDVGQLKRWSIDLETAST